MNKKDKEKCESEKKAFELERQELLSSVPKEFHVFFTKTSWDYGHSYGYHQVICYLRDLLGDFNEALEDYKMVHEHTHKEDLWKRLKSHVDISLEGMKMIKMTISSSFSFDSAHHLPLYKGKCADLHGHHWVLEVEVGGEYHAETGMIMDFGTLKRIVNQQIIEVLDHSDLNLHLENPTAENILIWIHERLKPMFFYNKICCIRLWETPDNCASLKIKEEQLS